MAGTTERPQGATAIRPFTFEAPEADLEDLRARIIATRFPEKETVSDQSQGVQLATSQALARYWATEHDWRTCEARLNALPNFITEIDGLDIHFVHVRSKHEDALPVIVTHGWPGSPIEQLKIIEGMCEQLYFVWKHVTYAQLSSLGPRWFSTTIGTTCRHWSARRRSSAAILAGARGQSPWRSCRMRFHSAGSPSGWASFHCSSA